MSKINSTLQAAVNQQINKEMYSSYLYLAMSAYCETLNFPGTAHWLRAQSQEEWEHAMRLFQHLIDRDGKVKLETIPQPPSEFGTLKEIFQNVLEHEQSITKSIHELYELALKENDYPLQIELQWFINEQVEEEKSAAEILEQIKMIGDHKGSLIMLDRHLATR